MAHSKSDFPDQGSDLESVTQVSGESARRYLRQGKTMQPATASREKILTQNNPETSWNGKKDLSTMQCEAGLVFKNTGP